MIRGTTPSHILTIEGYDLTGTRIYVTLSSGRSKVTKTNEDLTVSYENETTSILLFLTQEDTLGLPTGTAEIQVRWIDSDGIAQATEIETIAVDRVLWPKVISYDGGDGA